MDLDVIVFVWIESLTKKTRRTASIYMLSIIGCLLLVSACNPCQLLFFEIRAKCSSVNHEESKANDQCKQGQRSLLSDPGFTLNPTLLFIRLLVINIQSPPKLRTNGPHQPSIN